MRLFNVSFWRLAFRRKWSIAGWTFSAYGGLWLAVEILAHFRGPEFAAATSEYFWLFVGLGAVIGFVVGMPRLRTSISRIQGGDTRLDVRVIDMFKVSGTYVIPTNRNFDMDINGVAEKANSVQAEVIHRFYGGRAARLQHDIDEALTRGDGVAERKPTYALGTTVNIQHGEQTFYFTAVDELTEYGRAEATYDGGIEALGGLWRHVAVHGDRAHLVLPLVGTGKGRVKNLSREHAVERTIKTFLEANSKKTFCDAVTICVFPGDFELSWFDLENIKCFAEIQVRYLSSVQQAQE